MRWRRRSTRAEVCQCRELPPRRERFLAIPIVTSVLARHWVPTFSGVWYGSIGGPKGWGYGPDRPRLALPYPQAGLPAGGGYGLELGWPILPYHTPQKVGTLGTGLARTGTNTGTLRERQATPRKKKDKKKYETAAEPRSKKYKRGRRASQPTPNRRKANRREDREERGAPSDGGWGDRAEGP